MTFKRAILCSAAIASILLTTNLVAPTSFSVVSQAQAASNISVDVSIGTFYDSLAPDGSWVSYQDQYVWLPENVSDNWRPYTEGHWSYTRHHGWLWVSNERFGWATYHYGRWGYARDIGWYWVPGRRWAPAWVAWNHTNNAIAWAPLPPQNNDDVNISISVGDVPDYYWQAVPASAFLSINLSSEISHDRNYVRTVVQSGPPQTVIIQNNIVINNVIEPSFVEQQTKTKVIVHDEQSVNNPNAVGKTDGATVAIFNPVVKADTTAKPATTKTVDVVAKERVAKGVPLLDPTADQSKAVGKAPDGAAPPAVKTDTLVVDPNAAKTDKNALVKATGGTVLPTPKTDTSVVDPNAPKVANPVAPLKAGQPITAKQPDTGKAIVVAPVPPPKMDNSAKTIVPQPVQPKVDLQKTNQQNIGQEKIDKMKLAPMPSNQPGVKNTTIVPAIKPLAPRGKDVKQNNNAGKPPVDNKKPKGVCDPAVETCPPTK